MSSGSALYFGTMAYNNSWANHRLYEACAVLSEDELRAPRTSFFPSISLTLHHLMLVDRFYIDALEGGELGYTVFADHDRPPALAEIRAQQIPLDQRLVALCSRLDDTGLAAPVRIYRANHIQVERADRTLLHLFQHQIHHRGQVHAMLAGTRAKPPQLDEFFMADEGPLREADFTELGFEEQTIWRGI